MTIKISAISFLRIRNTHPTSRPREAVCIQLTQGTQNVHSVVDTDFHMSGAKNCFTGQKANRLVETS
jgi:hypothetical protein